ncbi:hypothetical protein RclHR1_01080008 [Rhizophagus clarus]|uniref:Uncharacterized protein n=1 Tax=Rhizophagus clarus TaxID=94130 RepID=A0A2Z6Q711_9GLOM|nr:hypothetical protein RclHR1_01080008 [Rhizophagus clarus]
MYPYKSAMSEINTPALRHSNWKLELEEKDLEIIHKQRVNGRDFLKLTEEKLLRHPYNLPGGPTSRLADFAE